MPRRAHPRTAGRAVAAAPSRRRFLRPLVLASSSSLHWSSIVTPAYTREDASGQSARVTTVVARGSAAVEGEGERLSRVAGVALDLNRRIGIETADHDAE